MSSQRPFVRTRLRLALLALPLAVGACGSLGGEGPEFQLSSLTMRDDPETAHAQGVSAFSEGRYGLAIKHFSDAVAAEPSSVESLNGLAASYDRIGRYDLAERYYKRALGIDPNSTQTLNNLGYSYLLQRRFDVALVYLREAEYIASSEPQVEGNLAIAQAAASDSQGSGKEGEEDTPLPDLLAANEPRERRSRIVRRTTVVQELLLEDGKGQASSDAAARPLERLNFLASAAGQSQIAARGIGEVGTSEAPLPDERPTADNPTVALPPREPAVIEVANGVGRLHMAHRVRDYLAAQGVDVSLVTNADHFDYADSRVFYREGWRQAAEQVAAKLPRPVEVEEAAEQSVDIRLRLGRDLAEFDQELVSEEAGPLLQEARANFEV